MSADYIFILSDAHHSLRQSLAKLLVVEPSPVRGLAADSQLLKRHLGFNLVPSHTFFLLS
nr:MAG TPA: hypothetical protein [Caudoviricetes sp.]